MSLTRNDVRQSLIRTRRYSKSALAYAAAAAVATTVTSAHADFTGPYDPANWTTTATNPDQTVVNDGSTAVITGTDFGVPDSITYSVTVAETGSFDFDWSYINLGGDYGSFDYAGFLVEGDFTLLATNDDALGGAATGFASVDVDAGQTFAFAVASLDGNFGAGQLTIGNFNATVVPEPTSLGLLAIGTIGGLLAGRRRRD